MKRSIYIVLILAFVVLHSFKPSSLKPSYCDEMEEDFSSNPPAATTGAPGEVTCVNCHSGSTLPASGIVTFSFSGANDKYATGESYIITIGKSGSVKTGFEMTALDDNNNAAGDFTAGANTSLTSHSGRNYIRHSASAGISSWSFTWNAPSTSLGDVTFYYSLNESNNDNNSQGDQIYLGSNTISYDLASGVVENKKRAEAVEVSLNSGQLVVNLNLPETASIYYTSQNLSGRQIDFHSFGQKQQGNHVLTIHLGDKYTAGFYLFTIFIDNKPYTSKIVLP
ncbi:Reeler domain-containing protein [Parvicella tangerina]|uniref:Reelin domain-containing protein n=1 Tax=Parvicella tangerina TaxID=2829795 RepID=A0A916JK34_9FLAO|nr:Reeler domain-containing protein [Parvicella tangerina]CAG5076267.1 hypothetical protein CRYO30217_00021 [Parvicella tangerina]